MTMPDDIAATIGNIDVSTYKPSESLGNVPICSTWIDTGLVDMNVCVGTTGYHGGDNGCDTYLELADPDGNFAFTTLKNKTGQNIGVTISARGDMELDALIGSLRFALQMLEIQRKTLSAKDDAERERKAAPQGD